MFPRSFVAVSGPRLPPPLHTRPFQTRRVTPGWPELGVVFPGVLLGCREARSRSAEVPPGSHVAIRSCSFAYGIVAGVAAVRAGTRAQHNVTILLTALSRAQVLSSFGSSSCRPSRTS